VADRGRREGPYATAQVLAAWAVTNSSYVRGTVALRAGILDFDRLPAETAFALIYALVLEESEDTRDRREELDAQLASYVTPIEVGERSDRDRLAATWGRSPAQQRAMRRAITAGESGADGKA
jgi:predicted outer membrane lipoprotein